MAESNSDVVYCPCGFYGRPDTAGLCSKCYQEHLQRKNAQANETSPNAHTSSTSSITPQQISQALSQAGQAMSGVGNKSDSVTQQKQVEPQAADKQGAEEAQQNATDKENDESSIAGESSSPNGVKRVREPSESETTSTDGSTTPLQRNKKRCFTCNCKLQPAIREIGKCKCDLVFCQLHRLPEQHDCMYDHKERGRQEDRDKMVSPKKHVGTMLKRIDS